MSEHVARNHVSPTTSGERKRIFSAEDGYDDYSKRRYADMYSTMGSSTRQAEAGTSSPRSSHGGVHASSYPVSSLSYSPYQRGDEAGYNDPYGSQYRDSSTQRGSTTERSGFPSYDTRSTEQGYPGQSDFHVYYQDRDVGRRNHEVYSPSLSYEPAPTKRNRFNLSRYQLDDDDSVPDQFAAAVDEDVKPNRFKTQRERLMQSRAEEDEGSDSEGYDDAHQTIGGEDSSSRDNGMSQRERLKRFSAEYSHHVAIPNQWEGEKRLHEFVSFGNVEAALRPFGLMMARAALVNDSMSSRYHCSSSSGMSPCHSNHSNPLTTQS